MENHKIGDRKRYLVLLFKRRILWIGGTAARCGLFGALTERTNPVG